MNPNSVLGVLPRPSRFWAGPLLILCAALGRAQPATRPEADFWRPDGPVSAVAVTSDRIYLGGQFSYVGPYTGGGGVVDLESGAPRSVFPIVAGVVTAAAADGQGGWYIGGDFDQVGGIVRSNLAHVLANGTVDPIWEANANNTNAVLVLVGDRLYVGGAFTRIGSLTRNRVAALDAVTGQVLAWNPNSQGKVNTIAVAGDTVYLGGSFTQMGGQTRNRLAAVDSVTGSLKAWKPGASGGGNVVNAMAVVGNTVYVGGSFTTLGTKPRNRIGALDVASDVALDWNPNASGTVNALIASGDVVYAAGEFISIGAQNRNRLAALSTVDGLATAWDPNVDGAIITMTKIDNTLYLGGVFTTVGATARQNAASVDTTTGDVGVWDPALSTFGASAYRVLALAPGTDSLCLGGNFTSLGGVSRKNAAALDRVSRTPTAWDPQASGVVKVLAYRDPYVYAGGVFTSIGGQTRSNLAALHAETGEASDWDPVVIGRSPRVTSLAFSANTVFVGGSFTNVGGATRNGLAALSLSTGTALDWNASPVGIGTSGPSVNTNTLLLAGDRLYVGGEFSSIGGQPRLRLAALDVARGVAVDWDSRASNAVNSLFLAGDTLLVGGAFTNVGGLTRSRLAALDTTTGGATTWCPAGASAVVWALDVAGNSVYVAGAFTSIGGEFRNRLAIVSREAGQSGDWNPNVNGTVRALVATPEAVYIGGEFTTVGGLPHRYFAVLPIVTVFASPTGDAYVNPAGEFETTLQVGDGQRVLIQASSDLTHWESIQTNTPAGSSIPFKDAAATTFPHRFYRAVLEP